MKLPIKHKYFEQIKKGHKNFEFRDAHITFIDEKTCEQYRREVTEVSLLPRKYLIKNFPYLKEILEDDKTIVFRLK